MFHWMIHTRGIKGWHAAVAVGQKVYCFGGVIDKDRGCFDVHVFHTVALRWTTLPRPTRGRGRGQCRCKAPSRCSGHTAVLIEEIAYIWGGEFMCYSERLYAFDVNRHKWFKPRVSGTVPKGRKYHSACVSGKVMLIYGGLILDIIRWTNDMYKLDTSTMIWTLIDARGCKPSTSYYPCVTISGRKMFESDRYSDDVKVFDMETNVWLTPIQRAKRHYLNYSFAYSGEVYFSSSSFKHLWKLSPETFSRKKLEIKGKIVDMDKRYGYISGTCCCCVVGDHVVLLGRDLHILDLNPSLKTLCKLSAIRYDLEQSSLPHDIRWELAALSKCQK